jgi:hypothetical protein
MISLGWSFDRLPMRLAIVLVLVDPQHCHFWLCESAITSEDFVRQFIWPNSHSSILNLWNNFHFLN